MNPAENDPLVPGTVAILLAAGESRRMGLPKSLLLTSGIPLIIRLVRTLQDAGVEKVLVVTNQRLLDTIQEALDIFLTEAAKDRVSVQINPQPDATMLASIQVGLQHLGDARAFLVCPVDLPLLTPASVYAILNRWHGDPYDSDDPAWQAQAIVVPTCEGKRGHPTLFGHGWLDVVTMLNASQVGLNYLLKQEEARVIEVAVEDLGVLRDGDTPEEWKSLTGGPPECWRSEGKTDVPMEM